MLALGPPYSLAQHRSSVESVEGLRSRLVSLNYDCIIDPLFVASERVPSYTMLTESLASSRNEARHNISGPLSTIPCLLVHAT